MTTFNIKRKNKHSILAYNICGLLVLEWGESRCVPIHIRRWQIEEGPFKTTQNKKSLMSLSHVLIVVFLHILQVSNFWYFTKWIIVLILVFTSSFILFVEKNKRKIFPFTPLTFSFSLSLNLCLSLPFFVFGQWPWSGRWPIIAVETTFLHLSSHYSSLLPLYLAKQAQNQPFQASN